MTIDDALEQLRQSIRSNSPPALERELADAREQVVDLEAKVRELEARVDELEQEADDHECLPCDHDAEALELGEAIVGSDLRATMWRARLCGYDCGAEELVEALEQVIAPLSRARAI